MITYPYSAIILDKHGHRETNIGTPWSGEVHLLGCRSDGAVLVGSDRSLIDRLEAAARRVKFRFASAAKEPDQIAFVPGPILEPLPMGSGGRYQYLFPRMDLGQGKENWQL